ncbi:MAG TPA: hypothetical protein VLS96_04615 [Nodosilinea sp.]|nr:hypothetical protein [Nodosilinea sp.]
MNQSGNNAGPGAQPRASQRPRPWRWSRRLGLSLLAAALLAPPLAQAQQGPSLESDRILRSNQIILRHPPIIVVPYPVPAPEAERVRIEFDARGTDWGAVYLNNRLIYRPQNFDRQKTVYLPPGGYRLEITGVVRADLWASGYLDLGRDSSRLVVIRFSKTGGVTVSGSPYVWIPD